MLVCNGRLRSVVHLHGTVKVSIKGQVVLKRGILGELQLTTAAFFAFLAVTCAFRSYAGLKIPNAWKRKLAAAQ